MDTRRLLPLLGLAPLLLVLMGCPFSPDKDKKPPKDPPIILKRQTSPENVLYNLQAAYKAKDITAYDSLLYDAAAAGDTTEGYTFRFAQGDNIEPTWGREEDLTATRALFGATRVEDITINLTHGPSEWVNSPQYAGQKEILVTYVYLNVEDRDPDSGDLTEYRVDGDQAYFRFKVQWVETDGDSLWRIIYWEDRGHPD
jgi:hypothetical protein